jgi:hypothetical protein
MTHMRFQLGLAVAAALALGAPLHAQDTAKAGGLNKVAHDISKATKKAGRDTKAEVHRVASRTHHALKKTGNSTKATLKKSTGVTTPAPSPAHKPGGLNKVARDVSHASKKAGSNVKHGIKNSSSAAHDSLKKAGNSAKATAAKDTGRTHE